MWLWNNREVTPEDLEGHWGFVYSIVRNSDGKQYIGKKQLSFTRKKKLTKKELAEWNKPGKKPTHKRVTSESDWNKYWGSEKELQDEVKKLGASAFTRHILKFCNSKKELSYYEENYQHKLDVLLYPDKFYNKNIAGKYFNRDLV